jgi:hypothetical protein
VFSHAAGEARNRLRAIGQLLFRQQQHPKGPLQGWSGWGHALAQQFDPHNPPLHKLLNRCGVAEMELPRRADHHRLPLPDRSALAILLLQQPSCFGIQPQQESWIGCHFGFEDQDRRIRLIGWGEEQAIQAVFPFFQHRALNP